MSRRLNEDDARGGFDPRIVGVDGGPIEDYEELYPVEDYQLEPIDIVTMAVRLLVAITCFIFFVFVFINVARGHRLKNWRMYVLVALVLFCWLLMSLYQDHIDQYFVHQLHISASYRSIYWCFRNVLHGLTLYLIVLLLAHLSDFQHHSHWLLLVLVSIVMPLLYAVPLLIIDLQVHPDQRFSWQWNVGLSTVRMVLYNLVTTVLLVLFSFRFCTARLTSTYEERRSPMSILVARWTFIFLLLHNITAITSWAITVAIRVPTSGVDIEALTIAHLVLDEVAWLLIVLAVPISYVVASLARGCMKDGQEAEVEMDKMDKIYQEVWTTGSDQPRKGRNGSVSTAANPLPGNTPEPRTASTMSLASNGAMSTSSNVPRRNPTNSNPNVSLAADKRSRRTSYMDAMSVGSMESPPGIDGAADRAESVSSRMSGASHVSVTSEPVDL